jgi:hypothetical protein
MGERTLIDTDILIEYIKGKVDLKDIYPYISEITLYEFIRGTEEPRRAKELLEESFSILWVDNKILQLAARIWIELKSGGKAIDDRDLIIGSSAIAYNLKLYTRNRKHFDRLREYGLSYL